MKNDSNLFFLCSLIEFIGRERKLSRAEVVEALGEETLRHIYEYADVLHCEPIAAVADGFIQQCRIPVGDYDNVAACAYEAPDYWTMGEVYQRLIEDMGGNDTVKSLQEVYASWLSEALCDYNSDLFYQPRDYLAACYEAGEVLTG